MLPTPGTFFQAAQVAGAIKGSWAHRLILAPLQSYLHGQRDSA